MRKARTVLAALAGCSRSGPSSGSGFSIEVIGGLERGSVVHVRVQREGGVEDTSAPEPKFSSTTRCRFDPASAGKENGADVPCACRTRPLVFTERA